MTQIWSRSVPTFNRALKLKESSKTHNLRANALVQMGENDEAKKALRRSLELSPGNEQAQKALDRLSGETVGR